MGIGRSNTRPALNKEDLPETRREQKGSRDGGCCLVLLSDKLVSLTRSDLLSHGILHHTNDRPFCTTMSPQNWPGDLKLVIHAHSYRIKDANKPCSAAMLRVATGTG